MVVETLTKTEFRYHLIPPDELESEEEGKFLDGVDQKLIDGTSTVLDMRPWEKPMDRVIRVGNTWFNLPDMTDQLEAIAPTPPNSGDNNPEVRYIISCDEYAGLAFEIGIQNLSAKAHGYFIRVAEADRVRFGNIAFEGYLGYPTRQEIASGKTGMVFTQSFGTEANTIGDGRNQMVGEMRSPVGYELLSAEKYVPKIEAFLDRICANLST